MVKYRHAGVNMYLRIRRAMHMRIMLTVTGPGQLHLLEAWRDEEPPEFESAIMEPHGEVLCTNIHELYTILHPELWASYEPYCHDTEMALVNAEQLSEEWQAAEQQINSLEVKNKILGAPIGVVRERWSTPHVGDERSQNVLGIRAVILDGTYGPWGPKVGVSQLMSLLQKTGLVGPSAYTPGTTDWNNAVEHDLVVIRGALSRLMVETVKVSHDMDQSAIDSLERDLPNVTLAKVPGIPNPHSVLATVRKVLHKLIQESCKEGIIDVGGNPRHNRPMDWTMRPTTLIEDVVRKITSPNDSNTCEHMLSECTCHQASGKPLLFTDSIYDIPPAEVVAALDLRSLSTFYYTMTTRHFNFDDTEQQAMGFDQGVQVVSGETLLTLTSGESSPYENNYGNTKFWHSVDVLYTGVSVWRVFTMHAAGCHILRAGIRVVQSVDLYREVRLLSVGSPAETIMVPVIKRHTLLSYAGTDYNIVRVPLKLQPDLFNQLCDRNITGTLGLDNLVEYGLGIAHSKYSMADKSIGNMHISAEDVKLHAYLAMMYMRRVHGGIDELLNQVNQGSFEQVSTNLVLFGAAALQGMAKRASPEVRQLLKRYANLLDVTTLRTKGLDGEPVWDQLSLFRAKGTTRHLNIYDCASTQDAGAALHGCDCHTPGCWHVGEDSCNHCGSPSDGDMCTCCKMEHHTHKCSHNCIYGHATSGMTRCKCCDVIDDCNPCKNCEREPNLYDTIAAEMLAPLVNYMEKGAVEKVVNGVNKQGIPVRKPGGVTIDNGGMEHTHVCALCGNSYMHKHNWNYLQHPEFVGDCPWCEGGKKAKKVGEDKRVGPMVAIKEPVPRSWAEVVSTPRPGQQVTPSTPAVKAPTTEPAQAQPEDRGEAVFSGPDLSTVSKLIDLVGPFVSQCITEGSEAAFDDLQRTPAPQYTTILYATGAGMITFPSDRVRVRNMGVMQNYQDKKCVMHSLRVVWQNPPSIMEMESTTNKDGMLSAVDVMLIAQRYQRPILVLHREQEAFCYHPYGHSGPTPTIFIHEIGSGNYHCVPAEGVQLGLHAGFPWPNCDLSQGDLADIIGQQLPSFDDLTVDERLAMYDPVLNWWNNVRANANSSSTAIMFRDGVISNVSVQTSKVKDTGFSIDVPTEMDNAVRACLRGDAKFFTEDVSTRSTGAFSIKERLRAEWMLTLAELCNALTTPHVGSVGTFIKPLVSHDKRGGLSYFTVPNEMKIKKFDMVHFGGRVPQPRMVIATMMSKGGGTVVYVKLLDDHTKRDTFIPKVNSGSAIRRLMAVSRCQVSDDFVQGIVMGAEARYGVPGSGKSTTIASEYDEDTTVTAMTSGALDGLRSKISGKNVISVERLSLEKCQTSTLVVDEASGLSVTDLALLLTDKVKKLVLYGDPEQVGIIDMHSVSGHRTHYSVMSLAKTKSLNLTTYRIPKAVGYEMRDIVPKLKYGHDRDGEVVLEWQQTADISMFLTRCESMHVECIYVFYSQHLSAVTRAIKQSNYKGKVLKVHSAQGSEFKRVAVWQMGATTLDAGIHLKTSYCYSAAGRTSDFLYWCSVGCHSAGSSLRDRIMNTSPRGQFPMASGTGVLDSVAELLNLARRPFSQTINDFSSTGAGHSKWFVTVATQIHDEITHTAATRRNKVTIDYQQGGRNRYTVKVSDHLGSATALISSKILMLEKTGSGPAVDILSEVLQSVAEQPLFKNLALVRDMNIGPCGESLVSFMSDVLISTGANVLEVSHSDVDGKSTGICRTQVGTYKFTFTDDRFDLEEEPEYNTEWPTDEGQTVANLLVYIRTLETMADELSSAHEPTGQGTTPYERTLDERGAVERLKSELSTINPDVDLVVERIANTERVQFAVKIDKNRGWVKGKVLRAILEWDATLGRMLVIRYKVAYMAVGKCPSAEDLERIINNSLTGFRLQLGTETIPQITVSPETGVAAQDPPQVPVAEEEEHIPASSGGTGATTRVHALNADDDPEVVDQISPNLMPGTARWAMHIIGKCFADISKNPQHYLSKLAIGSFAPVGLEAEVIRSMDLFARALARVYPLQQTVTNPLTNEQVTWTAIIEDLDTLGVPYVRGVASVSGRPPLTGGRIGAPLSANGKNCQCNHQHDKKRCYVSSTTIRIIRTLAVLSHVVRGSLFTLKVGGVTYKGTAVKGCTACAGLLLTDTNEVPLLKIGAQYENFWYRDVYIAPTAAGCLAAAHFGFVITTKHIDQGTPFATMKEPKMLKEARALCESIFVVEASHTLGNREEESWVVAERVYNFSWGCFEYLIGKNQTKGASTTAMIMGGMVDDSLGILDELTAICRKLDWNMTSRHLATHMECDYTIQDAKNQNGDDVFYFAKNWDVIINGGSPQLAAYCSAMSDAGVVVYYNLDGSTITVHYLPSLNILVQAAHTAELARCKGHLPLVAKAYEALKSFGANHDTIHGLKLSMDIHRSETTKVWQYVRDKASQVENMRHGGLATTQYVPQLLMNAVDAHDPTLSAALRLAGHNKPLLSNGVDAGIEQLHDTYVHYTVGQSRVTSVTAHPGNLGLAGRWTWNCQPPTEINKKDWYFTQLPMVRSMITDMIKVLGNKGLETDRGKMLNALLQHNLKPMFNSTYRNTAQIVNLGLQLAGLPLTELSTYATGESTVIFGLIPKQYIPSDVANWNDDLTVISYLGSQVDYAIRSEWIQWLRVGGVYSCAGYTCHVAIKGELFFHSLVRVVLTKAACTLPRYHSNSYDQVKSNFVTYRVPILNITAFRAGERGIFTSEVVPVPKKINRLLTLRASRPGTSWGDMLQYLRTLRYTSYYSATGVFKRDKSWIKQAIMWALAVYIHDAPFLQLIKDAANLAPTTGLSGNTTINVLVDRAGDFAKGLLADAIKSLNLDLSITEVATIAAKYADLLTNRGAQANELLGYMLDSSVSRTENQVTFTRHHNGAMREISTRTLDPITHAEDVMALHNTPQNVGGGGLAIGRTVTIDHDYRTPSGGLAVCFPSGTANDRMAVMEVANALAPYVTLRVQATLTDRDLVKDATAGSNLETAANAWARNIASVSRHLKEHEGEKHGLVICSAFDVPSMYKCYLSGGILIRVSGMAMTPTNMIGVLGKPGVGANSVGYPLNTLMCRSWFRADDQGVIGKFLEWVNQQVLYEILPEWCCSRHGKPYYGWHSDTTMKKGGCKTEVFLYLKGSAQITESVLSRMGLTYSLYDPTMSDAHSVQHALDFSNPGAVNLMIHAGGVGTCQSCIDADIPFVIVPEFGDQLDHSQWFHWATLQKLEELGINKYAEMHRHELIKKTSASRPEKVMGQLVAKTMQTLSETYPENYPPYNDGSNDVKDELTTLWDMACQDEPNAAGHVKRVGSLMSSEYKETIEAKLMRTQDEVFRARARIGAQVVLILINDRSTPKQYADGQLVVRINPTMKDATSHISIHCERSEEEWFRLSLTLMNFGATTMALGQQPNAAIARWRNNNQPGLVGIIPKSAVDSSWITFIKSGAIHPRRGKYAASPIDLPHLVKVMCMIRSVHSSELGCSYFLATSEALYIDEARANWVTLLPNVPSYQLSDGEVVMGGLFHPEGTFWTHRSGQKDDGQPDDDDDPDTGNSDDGDSDSEDDTEYHDAQTDQAGRIQALAARYSSAEQQPSDDERVSGTEGPARFDQRAGALAVPPPPKSNLTGLTEIEAIMSEVEQRREARHSGGSSSLRTCAEMRIGRLVTDPLDFFYGAAKLVAASAARLPGEPPSIALVPEIGPNGSLSLEGLFTLTLREVTSAIEGRDTMTIATFASLVSTMPDLEGRLQLLGTAEDKAQIRVGLTVMALLRALSLSQAASYVSAVTWRSVINDVINSVAEKGMIEAFNVVCTDPYDPVRAEMYHGTNWLLDPTKAAEAILDEYLSQGKYIHPGNIRAIRVSPELAMCFMLAVQTMQAVVASTEPGNDTVDPAVQLIQSISSGDHDDNISEFIGQTNDTAVDELVDSFHINNNWVASKIRSAMYGFQRSVRIGKKFHPLRDHDGVEAIKALIISLVQVRDGALACWAWCNPTVRTKLQSSHKIAALIIAKLGRPFMSLGSNHPEGTTLLQATSQDMSRITNACSDASAIGHARGMALMNRVVRLRMHVDGEVLFEVNDDDLATQEHADANNMRGTFLLTHGTYDGFVDGRDGSRTARLTVATFPEASCRGRVVDPVLSPKNQGGTVMISRFGGCDWQPASWSWPCHIAIAALQRISLQRPHTLPVSDIGEEENDGEQRPTTEGSAMKNNKMVSWRDGVTAALPVSTPPTPRSNLEMLQLELDFTDEGTLSATDSNNTTELLVLASHSMHNNRLLNVMLREHNELDALGVNTTLGNLYLIAWSELHATMTAQEIAGEERQLVDALMAMARVLDGAGNDLMAAVEAYENNRLTALVLRAGETVSFAPAIIDICCSGLWSSKAVTRLELLQSLTGNSDEQSESDEQMPPSDDINATHTSATSEDGEAFAPQALPDGWATLPWHVSHFINCLLAVTPSNKLALPLLIPCVDHQTIQLVQNCDHPLSGNSCFIHLLNSISEETLPIVANIVRQMESDGQYNPLEMLELKTLVGDEFGLAGSDPVSPRDGDLGERGNRPLDRVRRLRSTLKLVALRALESSGSSGLASGGRVPSRVERLADAPDPVSTTVARNKRVKVDLESFKGKATALTAVVDAVNSQGKVKYFSYGDLWGIPDCQWLRTLIDEANKNYTPFSHWNSTGNVRIGWPNGAIQLIDSLENVPSGAWVCDGDSTPKEALVEMYHAYVQRQTGTPIAKNPRRLKKKADRVAAGKHKLATAARKVAQQYENTTAMLLKEVDDGTISESVYPLAYHHPKYVQYENNAEFEAAELRRANNWIKRCRNSRGGKYDLSWVVDLAEMIPPDWRQAFVDEFKGGVPTVTEKATAVMVQSIGPQPPHLDAVLTMFYDCVVACSEMAMPLNKLNRLVSRCWPRAEPLDFSEYDPSPFVDVDHRHEDAVAFLMLFNNKNHNQPAAHLVSGSNESVAPPSELGEPEELTVMSEELGEVTVANTTDNRGNYTRAQRLGNVSAYDLMWEALEPLNGVETPVEYLEWGLFDKDSMLIYANANPPGVKYSMYGSFNADLLKMRKGLLRARSAAVPPYTNSDNASIWSYMVAKLQGDKTKIRPKPATMVKFEVTEEEEEGNALELGDNSGEEQFWTSYRVTYDPPFSDECCSLCFNHLGLHLDRKPRHTLGDIVIGAYNNKRNIGVINGEGVCTLTTFVTGWKTIYLLLQLGHCSVAEIAGNRVNAEPVFHKRPSALPIAYCGNGGGVAYYASFIKQGVCTEHTHTPYQPLLNYLLNRTDTPAIVMEGLNLNASKAKAIRASSKGKNLWAVRNRVNKPLVHLEIKPTDDGYITMEKLLPYRLYFIMDGELRPGFSLPVGATGYCNIYTGVAGNKPCSLIIDGGTGFVDTQRPVSQVVGEPVDRALTHACRAHYQPDHGALALAPGPTRKLYVWDYDNRGHHMFDLRGYLYTMPAENVIIPPGVSRQWMERMRGDQLAIRLSIKAGAETVCFECNSLDRKTTVKALRGMTNTAWSTRGDEYSTKSLDDRQCTNLVMWLLHRFPKSKEGKLIRRLADGQTYSYTKIREVIGNDAVTELGLSQGQYVCHHEKSIMNFGSTKGGPTLVEGYTFSQSGERLPDIDVMASAPQDNKSADHAEGATFFSEHKQTRMQDPWAVSVVRERPAGIIYLASGGGKTWLKTHNPDLFADSDDLVKVPAITNWESWTQGHWTARNEEVRAQMFENRGLCVGKLLLVWHPDCVPSQWRGVKSLYIIINDDKGERLFNIGNQSLKTIIERRPRLPHAIHTREHNERVIHEYFDVANRRLQPIRALAMAHMQDVDYYDFESGFINPGAKPFIPFIPATPQNTNLLDAVDPQIDEVTVEAINMFEIGDLSDWVERIAPRDDLVIKSREKPGQLGTTSKTVMTRYPVWSRPVFTKVVHSVFNAVSTRHGTVEHLIKHKLDPKAELKRFAEAWFKPGWEESSKKMKSTPVGYDPQATKRWINERPDGVKVTDDLMEILDEGITHNPINAWKVHAKLESLLKEDPINAPQQQKVRIIVWQRYGYAAIFSPIFIEIKKRFKSMLADHVLYTDGYTPADLSARLRTVTGGNRFFESDASKQDRQVTHELSEIEYLIYDLLGMSTEALQLWKHGSVKWRFDGVNMSGHLDARMMTGSSATAIKNVITNLIIHADMMIKNREHIKIVLVLGDDNLMVVDTVLDLRGYKKKAAEYYNMHMTPHSSEHYGTFCQMIAYFTPEGTAEIGPDYMRLTRRYEVTNGVSEASPENLTARAMSYAMWLGDIPEVQQLVEEKGWPIKPMAWYSPSLCLRAVASKHDMSEGHVLARLAALIESMRNPRPTTWSWQHWTTLK
ncbi:polyprotein [Ceratobasidium endornavirus D]|uniref:polyprotein n=1 Tax=Ceratobasidium endornavirus D TaxID=1908808 RepID=UPI00087119D8|nr:polyprotein [Ceratobasidium endornavirus D]AOV81681.1 polyprotein [Ceratobasidium endornavirus D]